MVISHKYKYIFFQNARTASTSMGRELCEMYGGERILRKHAAYNDFLKIASDEEKRYFAFTGQRNPLDALVTLYFRAKHEKLAKIQADPNSPKWKNKDKIISKWEYINENDLSFTQYFNRYHSYRTDRSYKSIKSNKMNFIYRYENLQDDFSAILHAIGIEQQRELPQHSSKTQRKSNDFYQYYTPDIQPRVQIVFGRSFEEMGYSFPSEWSKPSLKDWLMFYKDSILAKISRFSP